MTDQEWATVALVLSKGWKGSFGPGEDRAYRTLLDGYEPEQIVIALRTLLAKGSPFIPSASEIVQAIQRDPERPTFPEAFSALYDLRAPDGGRGVFWLRAATGEKVDEARMDRAWEFHPLLGSFIQAYGLDRLRRLQVDHDELAGKIRADLEGEWERFVEANEHRDAAALAAGRRRVLERRSTRKLDPAAALGLNTTGDREREVAG